MGSTGKIPSTRPPLELASTLRFDNGKKCQGELHRRGIVSGSDELIALLKHECLFKKKLTDFKSFPKVVC